MRIQDCETGEGREITVTPKLLGQVQQAYQDYQNELQRFCVRSQVPYFAAETSKPFDELMLQVFRRGGFLR